MKSWKKYLIEVLVIIFSILAAFTLEEWRERQKVIEIQNASLGELRQSLIKDKTDLKNDIKIHQNIVQSCQVIIKAFEEKTGYNDSLSYHLSRIFSMDRIRE